MRCRATGNDAWRPAWTIMCRSRSGRRTCAARLPRLGSRAQSRALSAAVPHPSTSIPDHDEVTKRTPSTASILENHALVFFVCLRDFVKSRYHFDRACLSAATNVAGTPTRYPTASYHPADSGPRPKTIPLTGPMQARRSETDHRPASAVTTDTRLLYDLYGAHPQTSSWSASSGAMFNLRSNGL